MKIEQTNLAGQYRTGTLVKYTLEQITKILGFPPNVLDDKLKVEHSWGFTVNGHECGIWDYKGSHNFGIWSVYDPANVLGELFVVDQL